jgi:hypothetical protein
MKKKRKRKKEKRKGKNNKAGISKALVIRGRPNNV